ncbi:MAG: alpha-galactosidase [Clostridia bacterium]|nr:alpha-galactosidase [Clostridia bacterium]
MDKKYYASFKHYMVIFDEGSNTLDLINEKHGARVELHFDGLYHRGECVYSYEDFESVSVSRGGSDLVRELVIAYRHKDANAPKAEVCVRVDSRGITLVSRETDHYEFRASGHICLGEWEDLISLSSREDSDTALRSAIGPASSLGDNAIYDKKRDIALCIDNCLGLKIAFDWKAMQYGFAIKTKTEGVAEYIRFYVKEGLLSKRYDFDYVPLKKRGKFDTPPAGFMTWYALKFAACEESVLRNINFQRDHLKDFGANTFWVDWEWCHRRYERERDDGVNNLVPDSEKYPRGLGFISEKIKEAGFLSALWVGATNDISMSDFEVEHPEVSLAHNETWSGLYYYDITSDAYLNGYLPKVMGQIRSWGYDAVKFDTLPNCIMAHEAFHGNMAHPEQTTFTAYRNMLARTRELLGEDTFMLGCGGSQGAAVWGIGYFDATRIGPDLFTWDKFCETLGKVRDFYPLHNRAIMIDADNVVLRDEYSTEAEARSRLAAIALTGLPLTFGDDLPSLPASRVDILKRGLPVPDSTPTQLSPPISDGVSQLYVTKVEREFESYTLIGLLNMSDKPIRRKLCFVSDIGIEAGEYYAYSFFEDREIAVGEDSIALCVEPHDTAVIALRKKKNIPQIISTSRHITSGAAELLSLDFADDRLTFSARLVKDDEYRVRVAVPDSYRAVSASLGKLSADSKRATLTFMPSATGEYKFDISFDKI